MEVILKRLDSGSKRKLNRVIEVTQESIFLEDMTPECLAEQIQSLASLFEPEEQYAKNPWTMKIKQGQVDGKVSAQIDIDSILSIYLVRKETPSE